MRKLHIVMYHYTRDLINSRYPRIKGLDTRLFEEQLVFFKNNFNVVRMETVIESILSGKALPEDALLLTFDDGYMDNYLTAFPLLNKYNLQGSFFIPGKTFVEHKLLDVNKIHFILASVEEGELIQELKYKLDFYRGNDFNYPQTSELYEKYAIANRFDNKDTIFIKRILQTVLPEELRNIITSELFEKYIGLAESVFARELYMNYDQIKLMKDSGMFIGLHGYDHYWLTSLSEKELLKDLNKSLEVMDDFIDRDEYVLCYPYGNYNDHIIEKVSVNGCVAALTTEVRVCDLDYDSRYKLPRFDCNDFEPVSSNWRKII